MGASGAGSTSRRACKLDDELGENLRGLSDHIIALVRHPDVVAVLIGLGRRLLAQPEPANQHVLPAARIANGDLWILREILSGSKHLAGSPPLVEAVLANRQHVPRHRAVEAFQGVGISVQDLPQSVPPLLELVNKERVVDLPSSNYLAWPPSRNPQILQPGEVACAALADGDATLGNL